MENNNRVVVCNNSNIVNDKEESVLTPNLEAQLNSLVSKIDKLSEDASAMSNHIRKIRDINNSVFDIQLFKNNMQSIISSLHSLQIKIKRKTSPFVKVIIGSIALMALGSVLLYIFI